MQTRQTGEESEVLCRIVHLSDIHVGSNFDTDLWGTIRVRVPELRPNVIIVSGDLIDTPRFTSFRRARLLLEELRSKCPQINSKPPILLTVPGNHDLAFYGNDISGALPRSIQWLVKPIVALLLIIANVCWSKWVGRLGYMAYFDRNAHEIKWHRRVRELYPKLILELLRDWFARTFFRFRKQNDRRLIFAETILQETGVLIVPFHSYSNAWFASGIVPRDQIFGLTSIMAHLRSHPGIQIRRRIAIVHHHPIPIPYTPEKEGLTEFEPYLCFRNAGTFLRELFEYNFDLVLHGHRHIPNFMRLNYNYREEEGEIGVLSAGSSALRTSEPNSFNVINIFRNGEVSLAQVSYGGGHGLRSTPPGAALFTIIGRKKNAFRRSLEAQGFYFERLSRSVIIDKHGTSIACTEFQGLKVLGATEKRDRPVWLTADQGCIYYVKTFSESPYESISLNPPLSSLCRSFTSRVMFNRNINELSEGFSYGIKARIISSHAMSLQQAERMGRIAIASSGIVVIAPTKSLEFKITLPDDFAFENLRFEVGYFPAIMKSSFSADGEIPLSEIKVEAQVCDGAMQEYERTHFRREEKNSWVAKIEKPIVGYLYKFVWDLPKDDLSSLTDEWSRLRSEVCFYQKLLLEYRSGRQSTVETQAQQSARDFFRQIHNELYNRYRATLGEERFSINLMTYDHFAESSSKRLVQVENLMKHQGHDSSRDLHFTLEPGVGNAGHAYQSGEPILYIADESDDDSSYYVPSNNDQTDGNYSVLASFPIWHPELPQILRDAGGGKLERYATAIIGILSIGSTSGASGLHRLKAEDEFDKSQNICQLAIETVLHRLNSS